MNPQHAEYLVIGAGPAGVQLAHALQRQGRDYLVLEGGARAAAFFERFPRHRKLISINKVFTGSDDPEFNMRHDWNSLVTDDYQLLFKQYDRDFFPAADNFVRYVNDFAAHYKLRIRYDTRIVQVSRGERGFSVRDQAGNNYTCRYLIVATGVSQPMVPMIEGIELCENYVDMPVDPRGFENQRVLILGKANSGFETADHLVSAAALIHIASPNPVSMAWKTHYVGHLRAVNNNFLDTYQLKSQNAVIDADIVRIRSMDGEYKVEFRYNHAHGEVEEIGYDRVLVCTGFRFDDAIFDDSCRPELAIKGKYPKITSEFESTNVPDLFFAGTITHSLDYRKATSGFIHGFRYNVAALARMLDYRNHGVHWQQPLLERSPEALTAAALERVNRSGGLWQQAGYIADAFTLEGEEVRHHREFPLGYLKHFCGLHGYDFFAVTLEYGDPIVGDPFNVERVHRLNVAESQRSQFLHPVVRHFQEGQMVAEHHVIEDLEAKWVEDEHILPLRAFFARQLGIAKASGDMKHVALTTPV